MFYRSTLWCFKDAVQSVGSFMHLLAICADAISRVYYLPFYCLEPNGVFAPVSSLWRHSQSYHTGQHVCLESMQARRSRFAIRPLCRLAPETANSLLVCSALAFDALSSGMAQMKQQMYIGEI